MSRYARLLRPTDGIEELTDEAVEDIIERVIHGIRDAGERGVTRVPRRGGPDPNERVWAISLQPETQTRGERVDRPDLEFLASPETLRAIIEGSYSPLEAFQDDNLRINNRISARVIQRLFACVSRASLPAVSQQNPAT